MIDIFVFIFGVCVGSFLNVCIHRMPREESIVSPGSHCPSCKKAVAWKDNIPLISFILLRGKCRHCKAPISPRYFIVELIVGLAWHGTWLYFGFSPFFLAGVVLMSLLIAVTMTDLETGLIPDALTLPGMVMGIVLSTIFPVLQGTEEWYFGTFRSLIGLFGGGGVLLLTALAGNLIFRKDSMGGGDIKLIAMMGAFLGWKGALFAFFFSPFAALPIGLYTRMILKKETIPFGPYLALAGALYFFAHEWINEQLFYF